MTRYFKRPPQSFYVEDDHYSPRPGPLASLTVPEHEAINTGLLDKDGDIVWRAPNEMGFVWKE